MLTAEPAHLDTAHPDKELADARVQAERWKSLASHWMRVVQVHEQRYRDLESECELTQRLVEEANSRLDAMDSWQPVPPQESATGNWYWLLEQAPNPPRRVYVRLFHREVVVCDAQGGPRRAASYEGAMWKGPVLM